MTTGSFELCRSSRLPTFILSCYLLKRFERKGASARSHWYIGNLGAPKLATEATKLEEPQQSYAIPAVYPCCCWFCCEIKNKTQDKDNESNQQHKQQRKHEEFKRSTRSMGVLVLRIFCFFVVFLLLLLLFLFLVLFLLVFLLGVLVGDPFWFLLLPSQLQVVAASFGCTSFLLAKR